VSVFLSELCTAPHTASPNPTPSNDRAFVTIFVSFGFPCARVRIYACAGNLLFICLPFALCIRASLIVHVSAHLIRSQETKTRRRANPPNA
jgi:hypothetical protein